MLILLEVGLKLFLKVKTFMETMEIFLLFSRGILPEWQKYKDPHSILIKIGEILSGIKHHWIKNFTPVNIQIGFLVRFQDTMILETIHVLLEVLFLIWWTLEMRVEV